MAPLSSVLSPFVSVPRSAIEELAEPLRARLTPEEAKILDFLVTLAVSGATPEALREAPLAPSNLAALVGAATWEALHVTLVDGHTVKVGGSLRVVRRTFRDLGLHGETSRAPTRRWKMLEATCEGHGTFDWKAFGNFHAASQTISVLRKDLRAAFGLGGDPFRWCGRGWKARFFASSEI